jgi:hypothetical protein
MKRLPSLAMTVYREESTSTGDLVQALCEASAEFMPVVLDKIGTRDGVDYRYASIMSIRRSTQPALAKRGVWCHHCYGHNSEGSFVTTILRHTTGEFISSTLQIPPIENMQDRHGAQTQLCRAALEGLLSIITEEEIDGEMEPEVDATTKATPQQMSNLQVAIEKIKKVTSEADLTRYLEIAGERIESGMFHASAAVALQDLAAEMRKKFSQTEVTNADGTSVAGDQGADAAGGGSGGKADGRRAAGTRRGDARVGEAVAASPS